MPIFKGCNYKKSHFPILFPVCFLCSPEVWISLISFGIFLHLLELIHGGLDRCVGNAVLTSNVMSCSRMILLRNILIAAVIVNPI